MFRYTLTLLAIFLVLNLEFNLATARGFELIKQDDRELQKRNEADSSLQPHSRSKRSWGGALRGVSGFAFAATIGSTIYTQLAGCSHFSPTTCKKVPCQYYTACPKVCQSPDKNNELISSEKVAISKLLDGMDVTQLNVLNLALDSASGSIGNERILQQIDEINDKVDRLMFSYAEMDRNVSKEFAAQSTALKSKLRDYRFSLDEIVGSEFQSIFDEWTWEGTGLFVLSAALPLGVSGVQYLRRRYAINKLYKEMRSDFLQRMNANVQGGTKARAVQRDYWIKNVDQPKVKAQLKSSAKALYYSERAASQPSKWSTRLDTAFNVIGVALSVFVLWQQYDHCRTMANDLQDSAYDIVDQHEEILKIKETEVDPLWIGVQNEAWAEVKKLMTNETTQIWLDEIRNLTLGAESVNTTTANTIQYFMDNIEAADVPTTLSLQSRLIEALKSIKYKYDCLADKLHAITIVLRDCESGRDTFEKLYDDVAVEKNELNRDDCVNDKMVPYTSSAEFKTIVESWAAHEGWYSNCLLNSGDLLYRVCTEFLKGYTAPDVIVTQVNTTGLTAAMVTNFLTRCPDPQITPKSIEQTCYLHCLYQPVSEIARSAILKESQVESIIPTCSICDVSAKEVLEICDEYYCKLKNATEVAEEVEIPSATIEFVAANNCSNKCIIHDENLKKSICDNSKCKDISSSKIATDIGFPEPAVTDVIAQCDTILPSCGEVDEDTRKQIIFLCGLGATAQSMKENGLVDLPLDVIQKIIDESGCASSG